MGQEGAPDARGHAAGKIRSVCGATLITGNYIKRDIGGSDSNPSRSRNPHGVAEGDLGVGSGYKKKGGR